MSNFQDDTLTYPQLIEEINALQNEIVDRQNADLHQLWLAACKETKAKHTKPPEQPKEITVRDEPVPDDERADWRVTLRRDPSERLIDALVDVQRIKSSQYLGLVMSRDQGDNVARMALNSYYGALARVISEILTPDGKLHYTARDWQELLEEDSPEADRLMEFVSHVVMLYVRRGFVLPGKSAAPSSNGTTGQTVASESSR